MAYSPDDGAAGEAAVRALAIKYGQGAIYAYEPMAGNPAAGAYTRPLSSST